VERYSLLIVQSLRERYTQEIESPYSHYGGTLRDDPVGPRALDFRIHTMRCDGEILKYPSRTHMLTLLTSIDHNDSSTLSAWSNSKVSLHEAVVYVQI
jgi:hypothetical protein